MKQGKNGFSAFVFHFDNVIADSHRIGIGRFGVAAAQQRMFVSFQQIENFQILRRVVAVKNGFHFVFVDCIGGRRAVFEQIVLFAFFSGPCSVGGMFAVMVAERVGPVDFMFFEKVGQCQKRFVPLGSRSGNGIARQFDDIGTVFRHGFFYPAQRLPVVNQRSVGCQMKIGQLHDAEGARFVEREKALFFDRPRHHRVVKRTTVKESRHREQDGNKQKFSFSSQKHLPFFLFLPKNICRFFFFFSDDFIEIYHNTGKGRCQTKTGKNRCPSQVISFVPA